MEIEEKYKLILNDVFKLYYPIGDVALQLLISLVHIDLFKKGSIVLDIDEIAKNVYILCEGAIIAYFIDELGNTYNKNIFLEGQFVGSTVSSLKKTPSEFVLEAIEDCIVITINYKKYRKLINENIELKEFYIAYLEKNWIIDKERREIALVMETAKTRYIKLLEKHPNIDNRIPLHHIASNLGITPTQLSRIRKELKK